MRGYQKQHWYADNFSNACTENGWNYTLFGYNDYNDQSQGYWPQYNYNYLPQERTWSDTNNCESPYTNINNPCEEKSVKTKNSNMLKAKRSGRVFYPSKMHKSRHNSHDNQNKGSRADPSPLNRSHDSTWDSSSGCTDSSSNEGSGSKISQMKNQSERVKEIIPIKLNFEDDPSPVNPTLIAEVISKNTKVKYELDPNDVKTVFEKFGKVSNVEIQEDSNKAVITMEDPQKGKLAEKHLNFYELPGNQAYLTVKWQFGDYEELRKVAKLNKPSIKEGWDISGNN